MDSLTLNVIITVIEEKSNSKVTHAFAPRPLIFKLQQNVLKFSDIFLSWSSPKIKLETKLPDLEEQSFENVSFDQ